jgi:hypothetical protein
MLRACPQNEIGMRCVLRGIDHKGLPESFAAMLVEDAEPIHSNHWASIFSEMFGFETLVYSRTRMVGAMI